MEREQRWIARGVEHLADVLRRRPDVLVGQAPRTLSELAQRLDSAASVTLACEGLSAPALQVLVAAVALGDGAPVSRLAQLLDGDPLLQLQDLERLDLLAVVAGEVRLSPGTGLYTPDLLGLGLRFAVLAEALPRRVLERAERALGLPVSSSKRATVEALGRFYGDPERVRRYASTLPVDVLAELVSDVVRRNLGSLDEFVDDDIDADDTDLVDRWQREAVLDRIGLDTGLMVGDSSGWDGRAFMPAEVTLALRGPDFRVRFDPEPPPVVWLPVSRLDADEAAAITGFDSAATAVLDQVAASPVPEVQAGGVGRRELQRLAKVTKTDVGTVLLVLELAGAAGLIAARRPVVVTDEFTAWREGEPAERFVRLARAWWEFRGRASEERDAEGNARRALTVAPCGGCRLARQTLLAILRPDAGLSPVDVAALAGWQAPSAHHADPASGGDLAEAERLGAAAQGALTATGAALVAGDTAALLAAAARALPASTTEATFGSDLTVLVPGSPSSHVSTVLDSCAVRESGGGAVTWRLSSSSIGAALDTGTTLADLRAALRGIATGGSLPAAVEVLLDDVGRVWGRAEVRDAAGVVVSDDIALLAQLLHDRRLASLGLQAVAPTVLLATADAATTTAALRKAGYMPAWPDGLTTLAATPAPVVVRPRPPVVPASHLDPEQVARQLLASGLAPREFSLTEVEVRDANRQLSDDEVAVLAAALDERTRVLIVYESSTGGITERVIRPSAVFGDRIWAWCELRTGERKFVLGRVLGVRPV